MAVPLTERRLQGSERRIMGIITEPDNPLREEERRPGSFLIRKWRVEDVADAYRLELLGWAPWLAKPLANIAIIAANYPETNLISRRIVPSKPPEGIPSSIGVRDFQHNETIAEGISSANRVNWDGRLESLGTWNTYAGGTVQEGLYKGPHDSNGNTIVMLSTSVHPYARRKGVGQSLIRETARIAREEMEGVTQMVAPLRPSEYGKYKYEYYMRGEEPPLSFEEYCIAQRGDGQLRDAWLRSATRDLSMTLLRSEPQSMEIPMSIDTFNVYRRLYKPEGGWMQKWLQVKKFTADPDSLDGIWECGETGYWVVRSENKGKEARYIEPNYWARVDMNKLLEAA